MTDNCRILALGCSLNVITIIMIICNRVLFLQKGPAKRLTDRNSRALNIT